MMIDVYPELVELVSAAFRRYPVAPYVFGRRSGYSLPTAY
jgi:hypothetical protein